MGLLILLYALSPTIEIPTGCFVAAWIAFALQKIFQIIDFIVKIKEYKI